VCCVVKKPHGLLKHAGHMGAKWKLSLSQIANLAKGLPHLLESVKWRKCNVSHEARHSDEKENTAAICHYCYCCMNGQFNILRT
jgi:hypothetical protein